MDRQLVSSGTVWESTVGYSRAVRVGQLVEVSGTTAVDNGRVVAPGNAYLQAKHIFEKIDHALQAAGATLRQVVRTRVYLADINDWQAVGKAHAECFEHIRPASTMLQVGQLIDPALLVEVEATAMVA
jgi:enamine deaminase RidA (YjgF/YER057c/UK114 family)